jgi:hypothetical protein
MPFRALAEAKARINATASNGLPVVNAMTEGFLDRSGGVRSCITTFEPGGEAGPNLQDHGM